MDIIVAQKRMMAVAQHFGLTVSTQSTIATAVAEISRVVIDKTDRGTLIIGMQKEDGKFFLSGTIRFPPDIEIKTTEEGLRNAQLLVPEFLHDKTSETGRIKVAIGIPRYLRITDKEVRESVEMFRSTPPSTPYEKLKLRNSLLNQQTQEQEAELIQTRLLDEKKNEFISVASHELKTPLTTILAFTKLALQTDPQEMSAKARRYVEKIDNQVNKLHLLIQQLLDISRIESGKLDYNMERFEWNIYMREIAPILEQMVPSHQFAWSPTSDEIMVHIDALRIEQVLTNLVSNAAKYSAPASRIEIECSSYNGTLTVRIRDQGIGINQASAGRLFDKYFRDTGVAEKYSGFGMGLYITSGIIREHHGSIWAEKNTDIGSTFCFTLPSKKR